MSISSPWHFWVTGLQIWIGIYTANTPALRLLINIWVCRFQMVDHGCVSLHSQDPIADMFKYTCTYIPLELLLGNLIYHSNTFRTSSQTGPQCTADQISFLLKSHQKLLVTPQMKSAHLIFPDKALLSSLNCSTSSLSLHLVLPKF